MKAPAKPLRSRIVFLVGSLLLALAQPALGQVDSRSSDLAPLLSQELGDATFRFETTGNGDRVPFLQQDSGLPTALTSFASDAYAINPIGEPGGLPITENGELGDGYYTTGAPIMGDGGFFFYFPEEEPGSFAKALELVPTALTWPNEPIGNLFGKLLCAERTELETELHDDVLGIQPIPERPPLVIEWNERFLGPGQLAPGFTTFTGAVVRPAIWVWGETRSGINYFDGGGGEPVAEWANRIDLFAQLNLSGTERILWGYRPIDEESDDGTTRRFAGYDFRNGADLPGGNFDIQTLFFEGDLGEVFPFLDPYDFKALDYGMSVGRMPLLAQQGLLINEDIIDAVTLTRNTLFGCGNLNLRATGVYAWDRITRNSPIEGNPNRMDNNSQLYAILTESDFEASTVNADVVYVSGDEMLGDLVAFGISGIQRHYLHHNTYNTSLHYLASYPTNGATDYARRGHLLFGQLSWTPHHYYDLIYVNAFWAIDEFTSPTRGPLQGGPLGQTGLVFSAAGLGRFGAPISVRTNDLAGVSLGYQWFFDETRKQLIWEIGGAAETEGNQNDGQIGTTLRYQQAIGQHLILLVDGFVSKRESFTTSSGGRTSVRVKF